MESETQVDMPGYETRRRARPAASSPEESLAPLLAIELLQRWREHHSVERAEITNEEERSLGKISKIIAIGDQLEFMVLDNVRRDSRQSYCVAEMISRLADETDLYSIITTEGQTRIHLLALATYINSCIR